MGNITYHHTKQKRLVFIWCICKFDHWGAANSPMIACMHAPSQNSETKLVKPNQRSFQCQYIMNIQLHSSTCIGGFGQVHETHVSKSVRQILLGKTFIQSAD